MNPMCSPAGDDGDHGNSSGQEGTALSLGAQVSQEGSRHAAEEVSFQRGDADGSRGALVGNQDEAAIVPSLQRHLRNNGDTHAGRNHAQDAAELAALKNDLRQYAGAFADVDSGIAEAVIVAQEQKRLFPELLHSHAALARQTM